MVNVAAQVEAQVEAQAAVPAQVHIVMYLDTDRVYEPQVVPDAAHANMPQLDVILDLENVGRVEVRAMNVAALELLRRTQRSVEEQAVLLRMLTPVIAQKIIEAYAGEEEEEDDELGQAA